MLYIVLVDWCCVSLSTGNLQNTNVLKIMCSSRFERPWLRTLSIWVWFYPVKLKAPSTILSGSTSTVVVAHALLQSLWGHSHWPNFLCHAYMRSPGWSIHAACTENVLCSALLLTWAEHGTHSFRPPAIQSMWLAINKKYADTASLMMDDQGRGCVWSGKEMRMLITEVWAEKSVEEKQQHDGSVRNVLIFAQIGKVLKDKYRIDRNTHQHHAKIVKFVSVLHSWRDLRVWHEVSPLTDCVVWTHQHMPSPGMCLVHALLWTCSIITEWVRLLVQTGF